MDIKTFTSVAPRLPAEISVLLRGPTGAGKSHLVKQISKDLGLDMLDVRGSTMDESKVTGIADYIGAKEKGVSSFILPSWFVRACREPVVLFLDELNRSMPQVMQSFFQIVLDRGLGNDLDGDTMVLHPETRVYAAVNFGAEYEVEEMDPALLRRFWVVDLDPTNEDWYAWASGPGDIDPLMIDFLKQNPGHLRVKSFKDIEPGTVVPVQASWHRLDISLKHMGMAPSDVAGSRPMGFYATCMGFVGAEAAIAFEEFVAKYENVITAMDIIGGKVDPERYKKLSASESVHLVEKIADHVKEHKSFELPGAKKGSTEGIENVKVFIDSIPGEQVVHFWGKIMNTNVNPCIYQAYDIWGDKVQKLCVAARKS